MLEKSNDRVRYARRLSGLSRIEISRKHGISYSTLCLWESKKNNISNGGAQLLSKIFQSEGIRCSATWLLSGYGIGPEKHKTANQNEKPINYKSIITNIYRNELMWEIKDNLMLPRFNKKEIIICKEIAQDKIMHKKAYLTIDDQLATRFTYVYIENNTYLLYNKDPSQNIYTNIIKVFKPIAVCL